MPFSQDQRHTYVPMYAGGHSCSNQRSSGRSEPPRSNVSSYTAEERQFVKEHFKDEYHMLRDHRMSIYEEEDREWGRVMARGYLEVDEGVMQQSQHEGSGGGGSVGSGCAEDRDGQDEMYEWDGSDRGCVWEREVEHGYAQELEFENEYFHDEESSSSGGCGGDEMDDETGNECEDSRECDGGCVSDEYQQSYGEDNDDCYEDDYYCDEGDDW